jgi:von Willebrand factor type A domain-containing protein
MGIRSARATVFAILAVALFAALLAPSLSAQAIQRSMHVTAIDQAGHTVPGLGPGDFVVREDKATREVLRVVPADDPMQLALLVDDTPAAGQFLLDFRSATAAFIKGLTDAAPAAPGNKAVKHSVAILTLASRPTVNTNYTTDQAALLKGAGRVFPQQATHATLLDGIREASEGLTKRHATRPVIVAVTTETEDDSFSVYDQVLDALRDSGATLYVFGVGASAPNQQDRSIVLGQGTADSGGLYETVLASAGLSARMTRLADQLTHQYLVTYARPNSLIPPEHVTVSAAKAGLTARGTLVKDDAGK